MREVARRLGRAVSTISRELRRIAATRSGGLEYRATTAQWHAERASRRPKRGKLAINMALRAYVEERLEASSSLRGSDSCFQRGNGNPRIDRAADRVADYAARPGIKNCRQIDEARCDRDGCDIRHPGLVRAIDDPVAGEIREDRAVVAAVSRDHEPPTVFGLEAVLAHQAADLPGINGYPLMAKLSANPAIAISLKFIDALERRRTSSTRQGGIVAVRQMVTNRGGEEHR
jgi:hypothetical protein